MATIVLRASKGSPLTNAEVDANFTNLNTAVVDAAITASWASVSGKPATLAGYGITDAQALDADLTAIAALAGTSGFLKKTAANTWALDTATYLTSSGTAANVSGTVAIANGGTGATTAAAARTSLGLTSAATTALASLGSPGIMTIGGDGVVEAGRYLDFHAAGGDALDYVNRIESVSTGTMRINSSVILHAGNYATYAANGVGNALGADLDTLTVSGMYRVHNTEPNRPSSYGQLLVMHAMGDTMTQIYGDWNSNSLHHRSGNPTSVGGTGALGPWRLLVDSGNYNNYAPTLTGTGASGTWGISVTGNAATVTNGVYTTGNQTIAGVKTFSSGIIAGSTQGYASYSALIDFGSDVANTWRRVVGVALANNTYSTIGFRIDVIDPVANNAQSTSVNTVRTETYYVACVRSSATTLDTPDACYVTGPSDRIRAVKTATGVYEVHIQNSTVNREFRVEIAVFAVNGAHTLSYYPGDTPTADIAQYASTVSTTAVDVFQNVSARSLASTVATGTAPLTVASTTRVANLNVATAGTADVLTTARTLTLGSTGKTFNGSANVAWTLAEIGALGATAKAADTDLFDGQDSSQFNRILPVGAVASIDTYVDNGVRSVQQTTDSTHLLSWNAGGSPGTVQQEFSYNTPVRGWRIRNKTDNTTWSNWGFVALTTANQGHISGTLLHSGNYSTYALPIAGGTLTGTTTVSNGVPTKLVFETTGLLAKGRLSTDANGVFCIQNAQWNGTAWTEDDSTKKKFLYAQHSGNNRHEFRTAASGAGVSWITSLTIDETAVNATAALQQSGNQVLHAGNYNTYAPTLTGTGASGSWNINVTGSANSAKYISGVGTNTGDINTSLASGVFSWMTTSTNTPVSNSYGTVFSFVGNSTGYTHDNSGNWLNQIAFVTSNETPWFRSKVNSSAFSTWRQFLSTANYNSYSPTLTGTGASGTWGIAITGNAATATTAVTSTYSTIEDTRAAQRDPNTYSINRSSYEFTNQLTGLADWHSAMTMAGWTTGYGRWQIIGPSSSVVTENFYLRSGIGTVWNPIRAILHSGNYNNYSPTLTGTGASGTWGISITGSSASTTGNAVTATSLQTGRTIALTGDVTYTSGSFNGSQNVTGTATLANSGVTAGTYNKVTVDAKGRVTAGAALASADLPTYTGSVSSAQITTGLGFTPYNATNPSGYITSSASITGTAAGLTGTPNLGFSGSGAGVGVAGQGGPQIQSQGGGAAMMSFHRPGAYAINFGLNSDNVLCTGGWSRAGTHIVVDTGNIGTYAVPLSGATMSGNLAIRNGSPTLYLQDTDNNSAMLHCNSNQVYLLRGNGADSTIWSALNGEWPVYWDLTTNASRFGGNMVVVGSITSTGTMYAPGFNTESDERIKGNWSDLSADFVEQLANVKCGTYDRIDINIGRRQVGVSAQSLQALMPEAVDYNEESDRLSVSYGNAALSSAVELAKRVVKQCKEIDDLKDRVVKLESLINKLIGD